MSQPEPPPSYTPQPYVAGPPPPRRGGVPVWVWALFGGCGGCLLLFIPILAAILFPVFAKAREKARQITCLTNLKQIGIAAQMYAQDNDQTLPPAGQWSDTLQPFLGHRTEERPLFHCPAVPESAAYGYAYNSRVAGKSVLHIASPDSTLLVYDSTTWTKNASDPGTSLPPDGRHNNGNNVSFADGHARWLRADVAPGTAASSR